MLDFGFYNLDCMEGMKQFPDDYFDLAIVDPPYGSGFTEGGGCGGWFTKYREENVGGVRTGTDSVRDSTATRTHRIGNAGAWSHPTHSKNWEMGQGGLIKKIISWDVAPKQEYFEELFRVSRNQIIWGGQLLCTSADSLLCYMAEDECAGAVFNGYGGIRLDFIQ